MINALNTVGVYVRDQQKSLAFFRDVLGFKVMRELPMGDDSFWIEVAPEGATTTLLLFTPEGMEDRIGSFANVVFGTSDIKATYEELKGKGVVFLDEPKQQPWGGLMALFNDIDGNTFVLVQRFGV